MGLSLQNREYILLTIGICLIIIHGLWPTLFIVDIITIALLIIIAIPYLAHFLKKAKVYGAELEFKDEILATGKLVDLSIQKAKETESEKATDQPQPFAVFDLNSVNNLIPPIFPTTCNELEINFAG